MNHHLVKITKVFLFLSIIFIFNSCSSNKNFQGRYRSNFAQLGFFVTDIKFNRDSTVEFHKAGDLMNENLTGRFKVSNNIVYVKFNKLKYDTSKDTLSFDELLKAPIDTNEHKNLHYYDLKFEDNIPYHLKYKIKQDRLLVYNVETNQIIRRFKGSKKVAKFYLQKVEK